MNVDTDMLAVAVLIGGIILFAVSNQKVVVQGEQNPYGEVPMETDELAVNVDFEKVKKAQFPDSGDLPGRVQAIAKYIVTTSQFILQLCKYFDDNFRLAGNKSVAWLRKAYPDEFDRLQMTLAYCEERDTEFRQLWHELSESGEWGWLSANQNYVEIPRSGHQPAERVRPGGHRRHPKLHADSGQQRPVPVQNDGAAGNRPTGQKFPRVAEDDSGTDGP